MCNVKNCSRENFKTPWLSIPLPKFWLDCNHAFENVGLNYAGPLFIKEKGNDQKCYILLFTSAVTRAIVLELCTDVSTMVLILAIRRFSLRRRLPKLFVSDNFNSLKSIKVRNFLLKDGIKWQQCITDHAFYKIIALLLETLS